MGTLLVATLALAAAAASDSAADPIKNIVQLGADPNLTTPPAEANPCCGDTPAGCVTTPAAPNPCGDCIRHCPAVVSVTAGDGALVWSFASTPQGYALGTIRLDGVELEAPWTGGLLFFTSSSNRNENPSGGNAHAGAAPAREWVYAATANQLSASEVQFQGTAALGSCDITFNVSVSAHGAGAPGSTRVAFNTSWAQVQPAHSNCRYALSVPLFGDAVGQLPSWRSYMYPWAGNSECVCPASVPFLCWLEHAAATVRPLNERAQDVHRSIVRRRYIQATR